MHTSRRVGSCLFLLVAALLSSTCETVKAPPDAFLFVNDVTAPNVTRNGDRLMLTFGALSAAEATMTKQFDITFAYTQRDPTAKNFKGEPCDPHTVTNKGNDCDRDALHKVTVTSDPVVPGSKWFTTIPVGDGTFEKTCKVSAGCINASAVITFTNGSHKPRMAVSWPTTQNGDPNTLKVKCCNP